MTGGVTCAADDGTGGLLRGPAHLDRAAREEGKRRPEGGSVGRRSVRSSPRTTQHASGRFTPRPPRGGVPVGNARPAAAYNVRVEGFHTPARPHQRYLPGEPLPGERPIA